MTGSVIGGSHMTVGRNRIEAVRTASESTVVTIIFGMVSCLDGQVAAVMGNARNAALLVRRLHAHRLHDRG